MKRSRIFQGAVFDLATSALISRGPEILNPGPITYLAAPADYWDTFDLKAIQAGGLVREDVMEKIWDISRIPLPFTDRIGSDTADNSYTEWTTDALNAPDVSNAVVSGSDASGNDAAGGQRVGNHCQNSVKVVAVTERAQSTTQIGRRDEMAYQIMMRQQELRRDVEAISLSPQGSQADDNNVTPGLAGGFPAWLSSNIDVGAGGASPGFNLATKIVDAPTPGTARALSFATLKTVIEEVYLNNGDITVAMSVPQLTRRLSEFLLANPQDAAIATPTANVRGEGGKVNQTAQGYVSVLVTDFGTSLEIVPNRLMQTHDDATPVTPVAVTDLLLIDVMRVALAYLKGYVAHPLAKLGLSERKQLSVDWTVKVYNEKAHGKVSDLNPLSPVVA